MSLVCKYLYCVLRKRNSFHCLFVACLSTVSLTITSFVLVLFSYSSVSFTSAHFFCYCFLNHTLSLILFENWKSFHFLAIVISRLYTIMFVVVSAAFRAIFFLHTSLRKILKNYTLSRVFVIFLILYSVTPFQFYFVGFLLFWTNLHYYIFHG